MEPYTNVLPTAPASTQKPRPKSRHSGLSILFMILLTGVLIILSEKIMYDINKEFNPATRANCYESTSSRYPLGGVALSSCYNQDKYEANRLLVHALVTLPILLGAVLLYILYERRTASGGHIASWAYFATGFWLCIRLLGEMVYFLIHKYESLGLYIVLGLFAIVLTWLVVSLQRRHARLNNIQQ